MDKKKLGQLIKSWMAEAGFKDQREFTSYICRYDPIDPGSVSRLLRGETGGRRVTPELLRAIARACSDKAGYEFDPTPALALAGYVIAPSPVNLPPALLGILTAMEPWELDLLTIELPAWREQMRRLRDLVQAQRHRG